MVAFMYSSMVVAMGVFAYGFWREIAVWRLGRPSVRWDHPARRVRNGLKNGAVHARLLRRWVRGGMHAAIAYGFLVLFLATVVVFVDHDLGVRIMRGWFYLYFQSLTVDAFGILATVGVGFYLVRAVVRRRSGTSTTGAVDMAFLAAIFVLLLTGFGLEGLRMAATSDPWAVWSPGGFAVSILAAALFDATALRSVHAFLWVFHVALWHSLLALVPFTRIRHAVIAPFNLFFSNPAPESPLPATDFQAEEVPLGIRTPRDMTWKQLMDLSTCTECARCTDACPAWAAGKPLSPMHVIVDIRDHVRRHRAALLNGEAVDEPRLAGGVVAEETLWACTTCRACEEACPVGIEHVGLILQLRQNLAMEQGSVPAGVSDALQSLEDRQHPFRGASADRRKWYEGLDVRELQPGDRADDLEVLYWVGCAVVSNPRVQDIARAFAKTMNAAGVRFAVLGPRETCNGDPARRTGNELHYDQLANRNIAVLREVGARRVVTHCPHCLQTLGVDYRQLGLDLEIAHHSTFIEELIASGRLKPARPLVDEVVTFHDPCYLGRHNRVFEAPRNVLDRIGVHRLEMAASGTSSMCCGAGGGHAFFQDRSGEKINAIRARQALATGAGTICTACPFCLPMLEEGVAGKDNVEVRDLAELVVRSLDDQPSAEA
jgi:Fe-S oxidoreductase/nitrate reductase gamma subunit